MNNSPFFSVVIPTYNRENIIKKAIDSVLSQSFQDFEIIIIDDCSTDNSRNIIEKFASQYPYIIEPIYNENNLGVTRSRNIALSHCSGEVITYLDGDDLFYKNKLQSEYELLQKDPSIHCVYSNFNKIDENGNLIGIFASPSEDPITGDIFSATFSNQMNVSSGGYFRCEMFYKKCLIKSGNYDTNLISWDDWDIQIRMSKFFKYGYCSNINSAYRKWSGSLNSLPLELHYRDQMIIYNKNKKLIQDLKEKEKSFIRNRVYSRIKGLYIHIMKENIKSQNLLHIIYYCIHFIVTFRTRKSISVALRALKNT